MVSTYKSYLILTMLLSSCGAGLDRVETIKGPPGVKGEPGMDGRSGIDGRDGNPAPAPKPAPTPSPDPTQEPKVDGRNGQGTNSNSVIIYNGPSCNGDECAIVVCACVDKAWRTILISKDQVSRYKIKNFGHCSAGYDNVFEEPAYCRAPRPVPSPQPMPAPLPLPAPKEGEC